jgi:hypothetical protein
MNEEMANAMIKPPGWPPTRRDEHDVRRAVLRVHRDINRQRFLNILLVFGILASLLVAGLLWSRSAAQDNAILQLTGSLSTACKAADGTPLPGNVVADCNRAKAGEVPTVVQGVPGLPGAPGSTGATGAPGVAGSTGPSGAPGAPGVTPPCLATAAMCVGATGAPGAPGAAGVNGVSPPCLATPSQCQGANGINGTNGANGHDGSPAQTEMRTYPDGSQELCTRSGGPDTAPTYACTQTKPVTPTPSPAPPA